MTCLQMPSGRAFSSIDKQIARGFAKYGVVEYLPGKAIKLKSGILSNVYVHGRDDLSMNPELMNMVALKVAEQALEMQVQSDSDRRRCYLGLPTAGTALAVWSAALDTDACTYIVREKRKEGYGAHHKWVVGVPRHDVHDYFKVDNVITDGGTKFEMDAHFEEDGFDVSQMYDIILVDRQQGGLQRLQQAGKRAHALFNLLDLVYFFHYEGLWPEEAVRGVEREISEHQLIKV